MHDAKCDYCARDVDSRDVTYHVPFFVTFCDEDCRTGYEVELAVDGRFNDLDYLVACLDTEWTP